MNEDDIRNLVERAKEENDFVEDFVDAVVDAVEGDLAGGGIRGAVEGALDLLQPLDAESINDLPKGEQGEATHRLMAAGHDDLVNAVTQAILNYLRQPLVPPAPGADVDG